MAGDMCGCGVYMAREGACVTEVGACMTGERGMCGWRGACMTGEGGMHGWRGACMAGEGHVWLEGGHEWLGVCMVGHLSCMVGQRVVRILMGCCLVSNNFGIFKVCHEKYSIFLDCE